MSYYRNEHNRNCLIKLNFRLQYLSSLWILIISLTLKQYQNNQIHVISNCEHCHLETEHSLLGVWLCCSWQTIDDKFINSSNNAPFRKISNSAQFGRFALILWRLVKGVFLLCFLGQIVTWHYNPNLLD